MPAPHPADAAFLAVLPAVLRHTEIQFRFVRCVHARDDLHQEALAYGLKWTRYAEFDVMRSLRPDALIPCR